MSVSVSVATSVTATSRDVTALPTGRPTAAAASRTDTKNTFETVLAFETWPCGETRVIILSGRPLLEAPIGNRRVEPMSGAPAEIVAALAARGIELRSGVDRRSRHHARAGHHRKRR